MRGKDKRTTRGGTMALVIVDMINPLDFPGGAAMLPAALVAARRISRLKQRLKADGCPVVYPNDNFTKWRMGFSEIVAICGNDGRGAEIARLLAPEPDDHFVLKPKHSAFFEAPLETLLTKLQARRLAITGLATDGWPPPWTRTCASTRYKCPAIALPRSARPVPIAHWN